MKICLEDRPKVHPGPNGSYIITPSRVGEWSLSTIKEPKIQSKRVLLRFPSSSTEAVMRGTEETKFRAVREGAPEECEVQVSYDEDVFSLKFKVEWFELEV